MANGNKVDTPPSRTYALVMLKDSVRIAPMLVDLNGLGVQCANVRNAYPHANIKEKLFFYTGEEFGKKKGKLVIIILSLYDLKGVVSK